jgi:Xaa-Pro aminopeptidase
MEISDRLLKLRAAHPMFAEPSFPTIAGSGPHGAIVHYRVSEESNRALQQNELMLLDSGGQYPDGTTDITRTMPVGTPSHEHKDRFTRVLKGHIAIATASFPDGTAGSQLDAMARQYLWQAGLDYDHGTGHGVGCFLGVHEGPQRISKRGGDAALKSGMIVSNEPGYYKTGEYGIRIENLVTVTRKEKTVLGFETLTCVPIDTRLVNTAMLTDLEKDWLNDYHAWVLKELSGKLEADEREWLKERCKAI